MSNKNHGDFQLDEIDQLTNFLSRETQNVDQYTFRNELQLVKESVKMNKSAKFLKVKRGLF